MQRGGVDMHVLCTDYFRARGEEWSTYVGMYVRDMGWDYWANQRINRERADSIYPE